MQLQPFYFQIAVKSVETPSDGNGVIIEGFASTPDIDRYRDIVEPVAFKDALGMFMKNPVLLRSHDTDKPAGTVLSAIVTDKGLQVKAEITEEETKQDVLANRMRAFSIGYIPLESTLQHEDGSPFNAEVDSVWDSELIRVIKKLDLVEISIVTTPANGEALFSMSKSVQKYFNQVVTKSFFMKTKNTEENGQPVETPVPAPTETPVETPVEKAEEPKPTEGTEQPNDSTSNAPTPTPAGEEAKESEEAENAGETPVPGSAEAPQGEAANTEATPAPDATETEGKIVVVKVKKSIADELTELKEIGVIAEDEGGEELSKGVVALIKSLSQGLQAENKRANDLQDQLDKIPTKQALVVRGQFGEVAETPVKKEVSPAFKKLFNLS